MMLHSFKDTPKPANENASKAYPQPYYSNDKDMQMVPVYECLLCKERSSQQNDNISWTKIGYKSDFLNALMGQISITMETPLNQTTIPNIAIAVESDITKFMPSSIKLKAEISAVKCSFNMANISERITLEGEIVQDFSTGKVSFTGLALPTEFIAEQNINIHLTVAIIDCSNIVPNVLQTYLSSLIVFNSSEADMTPEKEEKTLEKAKTSNKKKPRATFRVLNNTDSSFEKSDAS